MPKKSGMRKYFKIFCQFSAYCWVFNQFTRPIIVSGPLFPILSYVAIKLCDFKINVSALQKTVKFTQKHVRQ